MNKGSIILMLLVLSSCASTQFVSKDVTEVPRQKFEYQLNDKSSVVEVHPFYISIYPESNLNYKQFLASLSKNDKINALPQEDILKLNKLNEQQIQFLKSQYYISSKYDNYPIIGLNKQQISNYLNWKTDTKGKEILTQNKIKFNPNSTYIEIVRELNPKSKYLQVEYNVILESQAMALILFKGSMNETNSISARNNNENYQFLERLGIHEIEYYRIDKNLKYGELVYNQNDTINYYESLEQISDDKFRTSKESNIMVPLRTWHIKM